MVRHIFGGTINVGIPSQLSTMPFWGVHVTGVPADAGRCVSILQYVAQIGKVVAVTAEKGAATSALNDWLPDLAYDSGSSAVGAATAPRITGFPVTYTVIKNLDGVQQSPESLVDTCQKLGGEKMGIAIVRKKL